ncbi:MAG: hypothetical protein K6T65_08840 [Peptococcaceae bacterium]|nr:hypothetical protein [Peptococcaceae bacterium]
MIYENISIIFTKIIEFLTALCFIVLPLWLLYGSLLLEKYVWAASVVLVINLVAAVVRFHNSKHKKVFLFGVINGLVLGVPIFIAIVKI